MTLPDPRYTTTYAATYTPPGSRWFHERTPDKNGKVNFYLPASTEETWCRPGYQPKREDKGYKLTVNDYPFHPIFHGGSLWPTVVHTPYHTDN